MFKTEFPCEIVGFSDQELYSDAYVKVTGLTLSNITIHSVYSHVITSPSIQTTTYLPPTQGLVADLTEANGGGVWLPNFLPQKVHQTFEPTGSGAYTAGGGVLYWDACSTRVVEIRRCTNRLDVLSATSQSQPGVEAGNGPDDLSLPPIVVVLGICCNKQTHRRFVCLRPDLVREFVKGQTSMPFDVLTIEVSERNEGSGANIY